MDRHLFYDYFRRAALWIIALTYIPYCAYFFYQAARENDFVLKMFGLHAIVWMLVVFIAQLKLGAFKTIRILPITKRQIATTVWFVGVVIPFLIYISGLIIGLSHFEYRHPEAVGIWDHVPLLIFSGLLMSSGLYMTCFLALRLKRGETDLREHLLYVGSFFAILIFPYLMICFWTGNPFVQALTVIASIAQMIASHRLSPMLLEFYYGRSKPHSATESEARCPRRVVRDITFHRRDAWLANPLVYVTFGSFGLVVLFGLLHFAIDRFTESIGKTVGIIYLGYLLLLFGLVIRSSAYVTAMRAFGSLPITRTKQLIACLAGPAIALLPFAVMLKAVMGYSLVIYFLAVGVWQLTNAFVLQWNSRAGTVALLSLSVVFQVWLLIITIMSNSESEYLPLMYTLGVAITVLIIAVAIYWTCYLLRYSNAPYQQKPESFCGV